MSEFLRIEDLNLAGIVYLWLHNAEDFVEQCPEAFKAKNIDLLYFIIPVVGVLLFTQVVKNRR